MSKNKNKKSIVANVLAAVFVYLSLIYLWLSIRVLASVRAMFAQLGGTQTTAANFFQAAGVLLQKHTMESWAVVSIFYVAVLGMVIRSRRSSGKGLLDRQTAIIVLLASLLTAIVLSGAIQFIGYRQPMSKITTTIR